MKLDQLNVGDKLTNFIHWGCVPQRAVLTVLSGKHGLFVKCKEGEHLLDSQCDENGELIGVKLA